ncbi:N-methylglutamate dehydrogenase subunit B [Rhodoblastus acidophilus]|uniref:N-methylglutamate dehydrogenase subunit B n=1 Tax=Rhodoblastus acidophilus TaxID=1074 RepID=A0A212QZ58_RHOAC|nr:sarcosine oxidase subunit delta [Rhodoblastus acidophilus]PPQ40549.1 sarcosine oxidase subunit delta family protein [Rhodoblastus acidophilus]RAI20721.1 sarcosine oxidase subunit delta family protein [Rhodoblastus acidophilus]SNB64996.1 N-methylglutamate dehydrogenase subunit B [Rhodoblastus acidophilus]
MLIPCPYCGVRDAQEFSYRGDAMPVRPDPAAPDAEEKFHDYVYLRDNPAGAFKEIWHHSAGCRRWVEVERDTLTHEIKATRFSAEGRRA